jgi:hypothetical protein
MFRGGGTARRVRRHVDPIAEHIIFACLSLLDVLELTSNQLHNRVISLISDGDWDPIDSARQ